MRQILFMVKGVLHNRMKTILRKKISRKLQSNSGETIAETLVTMIIVSLAVLMLAGAVVTSAKINKRADNTDTAFVAGHEIGGSGTNSPTVTISEKQAVGTGKAVALSVNVYETEKKANKKYYYYNFFKVN